VITTRHSQQGCFLHKNPALCLPAVKTKIPPNKAKQQSTMSAAPKICSLKYLFHSSLLPIVPLLTHIQNKLRKDAKRKAIETEYMQRVSQAHGKIKKLYQDHAARVYVMLLVHPASFYIPQTSQTSSITSALHPHPRTLSCAAPHQYPPVSLTVTSTKAQNAQWDRLEQLLKKRQAIESKIHNEIKSLEEVKNNIAGQMICICNDRLQEMYEIQTMGKTPKDLK
jgi:hypothetical protein